MVTVTKFGSIRGRKRLGYTEYLGIPFAQKPLGELEYRHPKPIEIWNNVLDATRGSKNPIQERSPFGCGNTSEDCLYLNIFVPDNLTENAPVMFWIFGGSYKIGGAGRRSETSDQLEYELGYFAKETNTVVVSFNYRLNVHGFLNLNTLSDRFDLNNGLYDQKLALEFTREIIKDFGGNPDNITIFGHSAGGACVLALMVSDLTKNLFNRAIIQSPCIDHFLTPKKSERLARNYLRFLGISPKNVESIITLPVERLEKANKQFSNFCLISGMLECAFSPVIDGIFLKDFPANLIHESRIPLLIGSTQAEADIFTNNIPEFLLRAYSPLTGIRIKPGKESFRNRFNDALTQHMYHNQIKKLTQNYNGPLWVYRYGFLPEGVKKRGFRACHTTELPVEFGWNSWVCSQNDPEVIKVGKQMREVWSNFAKGTLEIPQYHQSKQKIIF